MTWTGPARAEAHTAALKVPEQMGIVRSKSSFGVRVPDGVYGKIYSLLKSGATAPLRVQVSKLFRLGPVPQKASAQDVQAWAQKCSWQVRVVKALGPGHWLVGSAVDPPSVFPAFNGQAVLIQPVRQRASAQAVVQSGSLPTLARTDKDDEDPWIHQDPGRLTAPLKACHPAPRQLRRQILPGRFKAPLSAGSRTRSLGFLHLSRLCKGLSRTRPLSVLRSRIAGPRTCNPSITRSEPSTTSSLRCRQTWHSSFRPASPRLLQHKVSSRLLCKQVLKNCVA